MSWRVTGKMIKTLISIRLRSALRSLVGKRKDGTAAKLSKGRIIGFGILYLYVFIVFAALFSLMAFSTAALMIPLGLDWLYFALFMLIAFSLVFIFSIFETKSELFECKDNELLLSMPINPRHIVISRIFTVLIYNYVEEALVMIPCIVMYTVFGGSIKGIIGALLISLVLPLLATSLSSGVGYLVALISKRVKKNSFITLGFSLGFLALYFVGYNAFLNGMSSLEDPNADFSLIGESFSAVRFVGEAAVLHPLWTPVFLVLSLLAAYIAYRIISASYISIVTDNRGAKRTKYRAQRLVRKSSFSALVRKELRRFFSSSAYMLNAGLGLVFMVAIAVIALINSAKLHDFVLTFATELPQFDISGTLAAIMVALIVTVSSMNFMSSAALSLEGKSLWILKTMPVTAREVLFAKAMPHIIVTTPPTVISSVLLFFAAGAQPVYLPFFIFTPIAANVFGAFFGIVINTAFPKFEFENEAQPIKQSLSTFIAMFVMMLYGLLTVAASFFLSVIGLPLLASGAVLLLTVLLAGVFAVMLLGPSARKYESFCA